MTSLFDWADLMELVPKKKRGVDRTDKEYQKLLKCFAMAVELPYPRQTNQQQFLQVARWYQDGIFTEVELRAHGMEKLMELGRRKVRQPRPIVADEGDEADQLPIVADEGENSQPALLNASPMTIEEILTDIQLSLEHAQNMTDHLARHLSQRPKGTA